MQHTQLKPRSQSKLAGMVLLSQWLQGRQEGKAEDWCGPQEARRQGMLPM